MTIIVHVNMIYMCGVAKCSLRFEIVDKMDKKCVKVSFSTQFIRLSSVINIF